MVGRGGGCGGEECGFGRCGRLQDLSKHGRTEAWLPRVSSHGVHGAQAMERVARNWDGFPDDGICQENWELWCMMGLLGVCASGSAVEGGGSAL